MRGRSSLLNGLSLALLVATISVGLRGQDFEDPEGKVPDSVKAQKQGPAPYTPKGSDLGKTATCPVDGKTLTVRADTPAQTYRGTVFFFDTKACETRFRQNPEAFLPATKKP